eukprot:GILI01010511.1.p1 GENE.GILI01010511.1~~GILI01010511.1.p1  ORF type:complete len:958 (-),score=300.66 GILI01010511.1:207-2663(-)
MLLQKAVAGDKKVSRSVLELYLSILKEQQKAEQCVTLLQSQASAYDLLVERDMRMAEALTDMGRLGEALDLYVNLVNNNVDDWGPYKAFIPCLLKLLEAEAADNSKISAACAAALSPNSENPSWASVETALTTTFQWLRYLQRKEREAHPTELHLCARCPWLAELELRRTLMLRDPKICSLDETLVELAAILAGRPSMFMDIQPYLSCTSAAVASNICEKLHAYNVRYNLDHITMTSTHVYNSLALHKCRMFLGVYANSRLTSAVSLFEEYLKALAVDHGAVATDFRAADDLLLLAVHLVLQEQALNGWWSLLVEAVLLLELGLKHSPSNFQFKLLLTVVHSKLGCMSLAESTFDSLSVKHIQFESLGYLLLEPSLSSGAFDKAQELCQSVLGFHRDHDKEFPELVMSAYKSLSVHKVLEFTDFNRRLYSSLFKRVCSLRLCQLQLLSAAPAEARAVLGSHAPTLKNLLEENWVPSLSLNQDRSVMDQYEMTPEQQATFKALSPDARDWTEHRFSRVITDLSLPQPQDEPRVLLADAAVLRTLLLVFDEQVEPIRNDVLRLRERLSSSGIVDMGEATWSDVQASPSLTRLLSTPLQPVDLRMRLALVMFDACISVIRARNLHTTAVETGIEDVIDDDDQGWSHVSRHFTILASILKDLCAAVTELKEDSKETVVAAPREMPVKQIALLTSLLTGPLSWLAVLCPQWAKQISAAKVSKATLPETLNKVKEAKESFKHLLTTLHHGLVLVVSFLSSFQSSDDLSRIEPFQLAIAGLLKPEIADCVRESMGKVQASQKSHLAFLMDVAQKKVSVFKGITVK